MNYVFFISFTNLQYFIKNAYSSEPEEPEPETVAVEEKENEPAAANKGKPLNDIQYCCIVYYTLQYLRCWYVALVFFDWYHRTHLLLSENPHEKHDMHCLW